MGVAAAIVASALISAEASNRAAEAQAEAQKKASEAALKAQKEASLEDAAMRRQADIDNQMSETAKTEYGSQKEEKRKTSEDLIIPYSVDTSLGGTSKRTGLGF